MKRGEPVIRQTNSRADCTRRSGDGSANCRFASRLVRGARRKPTVCATIARAAVVFAIDYTLAILSLLLLCAAPTIAQPACLPLVAREADGNHIVPGTLGEIVYRRIDGRELALDAYLQRRGSARPAVIVIHGGRWESGSRRAFIGQFLELLARAGYNTFAIDYRLNGAERREDSIDDARAAIAFIRCHARRLRIDPERIALLGEDAGADMAASLAAERPAGVKAVVLIGGLYDPGKGAWSEWPGSAAANRAGRGFPATLVIHGTADREAPPERADGFCAARREQGARCDYIAVEGAIHRPENWTPAQWSYKERLIAWLGREMGLERADHLPYRTRLEKGIVYDEHSKLRMDAYVPRGRGPFPAVVIVHGGGWEAGDRVTYVTPLFASLARARMAWFSIDYRLTPEVRHPEQLADVKAAIRFIRANARRFRIDPARIALLGESASGQMAVLVAGEMSGEIAAVVSFYGVYDFLAMAREITPRSIPARLFGIGRLDEEARALLQRYSPLYQAGEAARGWPPMLLICGTKDGLYAQHRAYAGRLGEVGARFDEITIEGAPHGLENWEGRAEWTAYKDRLVDWLGRKLVAKR